MSDGYMGVLHGIKELPPRPSATLEEVYERKWILEAQILELVEEYEAATGLKVDHVVIRRNDERAVSAETRICL